MFVPSVIAQRMRTRFPLINRFAPVAGNGMRVLCPVLPKLEEDIISGLRKRTGIITGFIINLYVPIKILVKHNVSLAAGVKNIALPELTLKKF